MIELLQTSLPLWTATAVVIGLLVGSFLNVVIHRLPRMLQQGWQRECRLLLALPDQPSESKPESLVFPGSRCPACRADIRWYDNIPVLSFLRLKGRCRQCSTKIGWRYPLVEAITALLTGVVAWQLGFGLFGAAAIALTWTLVALSTIDFDHQLLPDNITLPALWAGLLLSVLGGPVSPADAVIGAAVGYLSLWLVFHGFRLITGKEGMGVRRLQAACRVRCLARLASAPSHHLAVIRGRRPRRRRTDRQWRSAPRPAHALRPIHCCGGLDRHALGRRHHSGLFFIRRTVAP